METLIATRSGEIGFIDSISGVTQVVVDAPLVFTDIAVSPNGEIFASTFNNLYLIDQSTQSAIDIGAFGARINALAFAPDGRLLGIEDGGSTLFQIDPSNGAAFPIADIGNGFRSSGDLVYSPSEDTFYATSTSNLWLSDTLYSLDIDLTTGTLTQSELIGDVGFQDIFGLAVRGDELLGYSGSNEISIEKENGTGNFIRAIGGISSEIYGAANYFTILDSLEFLGPLPYTSFNNPESGAGISPFSQLDFTYFYLEDFEDGALNTPGVSLREFATTNITTAYSDSVDGDDGTIDGLATGNARSLFSDFTTSSFTFDFAADAFDGQLPTHAGIVWTDIGINNGGRPLSSDLIDNTFFEAFGPSGNSLGRIGPFSLGDESIARTTSEDRFFGVINPEGISSIRLSSPGKNNWEVDHLQYGRLLSSQGNFIGADIQLESLFPDLNTVSGGPVTARIGDSTEFILDAYDPTPNDDDDNLVPGYQIDFNESSILYTTGDIPAGDTAFQSADFNGFLFTDVSGRIPDIENVTIDETNNTLGLDDSDILFTKNTIAINVEGINYTPGDSVKLDVVFESTSDNIFELYGTQATTYDLKPFEDVEFNDIAGLGQQSEEDWYKINTTANQQLLTVDLNLV
jgi:hypothetical protein